MPSAASLNRQHGRVTGLLAVVFVFLAAGCRHKESGQVQPVFSREIAPILFKHCTPCHRPGSAGPFNLLTYRDARKKMRTIRRVLENGIMPPWPADTTYSRFRDEKILTAEEKEMLLTWIRNGAPPGDTVHPPVPPAFPEGSRLGTPDLTICMDTFRIEGNNLDHFMMIKVPYRLPADTFVRAIEIIPGNKKLAHHINGHLVQYADGAKKNLYQGMAPVDAERHGKREAFSLLDLQNDDGTYPMLTPSVTNYLPGVIGTMYPDGIGGYRVRKNGVLLLDNIHYGPSPVDTFDCTTFNFFFGPTPPERPVHEFILGTSGISAIEPPLVIAPNTVSTYRTQYTLTEDISLLTVNPHMHLLGKSFLAYAVTPGNDTIPLIRIRDWDFRWQYFYTFRTLLPLRRGTTIQVEGVYDNTENNPLNPFHPPQTVSERDGSMRTTDEMFQFIVSYTRYRPGDETISLETAQP